MAPGVDEVALSLLKFEHRYVPYEGMKRRELFENAMRDLGHEVSGTEMMGQASPRVVDLVAEAIVNMRETAAEHPECSEAELLELAVGSAATVAWCEAFTIGMFHARRLTLEGEMPNAER